MDDHGIAAAKINAEGDRFDESREPPVDLWGDRPIGVEHASAFDIEEKPYVTFLVGAGASVEAGYPLASDLFSEPFVRLVHRLAHRGDSSAQLDEVLRMLHQVNDPTVDFQKRFDEWNSGKSHEMDSFEQVISDVMFRAETASFDSGDGQRAVTSMDSLYAFVAGLRTLQDGDLGVSVISLNYDLNLEMGSSWREFNYGGISSGFVWPKGFGSGGNTLSAFSSGISFLKPHGSLNWLVCSKCMAITCGNDNMWYARKVTFRLRRCPVCWEATRPLFVPPVRAIRSPALEVVWTDIEEVLKRTFLLVVCGYSFPPYDAHVGDRIRRALSKQSEVIVIDPFALNNPMRYFGLGDGRPRAIPRTFAQVALDIPRVGGKAFFSGAQPLFLIDRV